MFAFYSDLYLLPPGPPWVLLSIVLFHHTLFMWKKSLISHYSRRSLIEHRFIGQIWPGPDFLLHKLGRLIEQAICLIEQFLQFLMLKDRKFE